MPFLGTSNSPSDSFSFGNLSIPGMEVNDGSKGPLMNASVWIFNEPSHEFKNPTHSHTGGGGASYMFFSKS